MGKEKERLSSFIHQHELIAVDTPVFIYHFEDHPRYRSLTVPFFEAVESGHCRATTSVLTWLEVLVKPLGGGRDDVADAYRIILDTFPNLQQTAIDRPVAEMAASLRAAHGLATPESLHLAGAIYSGCSAFITNDGEIEAPDSIEVLTLESLLT